MTNQGASRTLAPESTVPLQGWSKSLASGVYKVLALTEATSVSR